MNAIQQAEESKRKNKLQERKTLENIMKNVNTKGKSVGPSEDCQPLNS